MTQYIAIEGRGGSGKTYLSNILGDKLGVRVLHLDDYGNDWEPFEGIPRLVNLLDEATDNVVIFEGVGVFKEAFDKYDAYKIYVDTPESIRTKRAQARDVSRSDRSAEDWQKIWAIWTESDEHYYVPKFMDDANLVVGSSDGMFDIEYIVKSILKNLKSAQ